MLRIPRCLAFNAFHGRWLVDFDVNVSKRTKLSERFTNELRAEAFNIANNENFANPIATLNNSKFGRILAGGTPRQYQFALKLIS